MGATIVKACHQFKEKFYHFLLYCYCFHSYWPFMKDTVLLKFVNNFFIPQFFPLLFYFPSNSLGTLVEIR
jgi:hypothetical protein